MATGLPMAVSLTNTTAITSCCRSPFWAGPGAESQHERQLRLFVRDKIDVNKRVMEYLSDGSRS